ncbi:hypothetical protein SUGI_0713350 [Cryptomeria japonica]|uniref:uncharacterized protein LOC131064375 isoform X1 n=1 Tax=Cryptomeria japonica TaxID=3369 RepID=UPI002414A872|nr:uncharacterized protein LOC131064375 isoform X1 [Cryptomeria japonica]GLJ35470.1 hypothetical protein SUGI_0713350 [Cryptomeria japonica]
MAEGDFRVYDTCGLESQLHSNLECFLDSVTPNVRANCLPKSCLRELASNKFWQPSNAESVQYYSLGDLWECYDEWSAYGAGVPIQLNSKETVVQYYVPYLSALQIYTIKSRSNFRIPREESDGSDFDLRDPSADSWSDCSDNDKLSSSLSNTSDRSEGTWDAGYEDSAFDPENSWHLRDRDRLGSLYFEYFERSAPYARVPLIDKINCFAREYPELMSLRSVDLSPASWMSVAWYPIYHIPSGRTIKDLSACFLTYHTLSLSFQENENGDGNEEGSSENQLAKVKIKDSQSVSLPPFGLATYKMKGNLWTSAESCDQQRMVSLVSSADSWLKQLSVRHPDFTFFISHSM